MPDLPALLHLGVISAGIAGVLYTATVAIAAFTALFARTPSQRRTAQDVLRILLNDRDQQARKPHPSRKQR